MAIRANHLRLSTIISISPAAHSATTGPYKITIVRYIPEDIAIEGRYGYATLLEKSAQIVLSPLLGLLRYLVTNSKFPIVYRVSLHRATRIDVVVHTGFGENDRVTPIDEQRNMLLDPP
jgi:hypothetical protein